MQSWNIVGAWTSHGKTPPSPYNILYAWPWDQQPNFILSWDSQVGIPKFLKLRLPQLWRPITLHANLQLTWGLNQSCNTCQELSNGMWHTTCMQGSQGDYWLLVVESQIGNLTPSPSFGHNLCFNYSNESCKPILNIQVPRVFQWYNKIFNPMGCEPCNHSLKIQEFIGTSTPKVGAHLEVRGFISSHFPTLQGEWNVTPKLHSWPTPSQALALVVSPRLRLRH